MFIPMFNAACALLDAVESAKGARPSQPALFPHGVVCTWIDGVPTVVERRGGLNQSLPTPVSAHAAMAKARTHAHLTQLWRTFTERMAALAPLAGVASSTHLFVTGKKNLGCTLAETTQPWWAVPAVDGFAQVWGLLSGAAVAQGPVARFGFFDTHDRTWAGELSTNAEAARILAPAFATGPKSRIVAARHVGDFAPPEARSSCPWNADQEPAWPQGPGWETLAAHHQTLLDTRHPSGDTLMLEDSDAGVVGFFALANTGDPLGVSAEDWVALETDTAERSAWWTARADAWAGFWREAERLAPVVRRQPGDPARHLSAFTRAEEGEQMGIACLGGTLWHPADLAKVAHLPDGPCWWVRSAPDVHTVAWVRTQTPAHAAEAAGAFLMEHCGRHNHIQVWEPLDR